MQEGRSVAFESKKLTDREMRYTTHEKEVAFIVHCQRTLETLLDGEARTTSRRHTLHLN